MNERILIVDDDPAVCFTVQEVLRRAGLQAIIVESGEACLQKLREGFHGLIFLDIMMPKMDGWQTIEAMKQEGLLAGNAVCMLTALIDPGEKMQAVKDCVADYVCKPFDSEFLVATAREHLANLQPA